MATILRFKSAAAAAPVRAIRSADRSRSAEIIIFPGVRVERMPEAPPARARGRRARERDTLTLDD